MLVVSDRLARVALVEAQGVDLDEAASSPIARWRPCALCCELSQRAPVVARHHLDEVGERVLPVPQDALGDRRAGARRVLGDQPPQVLRLALVDLLEVDSSCAAGGELALGSST